MPWSLIFGFLKGLPGVLGDYFERKNNLEMARIESRRQLEIARAKLAGQIAKAELEKATAVLGATSRGFKYCTFIMWFGPFVLGVVWPSQAAEIFANLALMPEWYVQSCMTIMFTVWGISVGAPVIAGIFKGLAGFFAGRREAIMPEKMFYEVLRSVKGNLTQAEVDAYSIALKHINRKD